MRKKNIKEFLALFNPDNISKLQNMQKDIKVLLSDEFDNNFEREAFFTTPWEQSERAERTGGKTLQHRTHLRKSIHAYIKGDKIIFQSNLPYAEVHNFGGTVHSKPKVTPKMRRWAWAKYKETKQDKYKGLALTKQTHLNITAQMPQRQFIGWHPSLHQPVNRIISKTINQIFK